MSDAPAAPAAPSEAVVTLCSFDKCQEKGAKECGRCHAAFYCCRDHQVADYRSYHAKECFDGVPAFLPVKPLPLGQIVQLEQLRQALLSAMCNLAPDANGQLRYCHQGLFKTEKGFRKTADGKHRSLLMPVTEADCETPNRFALLVENGFSPAQAVRLLFFGKYRVLPLAMMHLLEAAAQCGFTIMHDDWRVDCFQLVVGRIVRPPSSEPAGEGSPAVASFRHYAFEMRVGDEIKSYPCDTDDFLFLAVGSTKEKKRHAFILFPGEFLPANFNQPVTTTLPPFVEPLHLVESNEADKLGLAEDSKAMILDLVVHTGMLLDIIGVPEPQEPTDNAAAAEKKDGDSVAKDEAAVASSEAPDAISEEPAPVSTEAS